MIENSMRQSSKDLPDIVIIKNGMYHGIELDITSIKTKWGSLEYQKDIAGASIRLKSSNCSLHTHAPSVSTITAKSTSLLIEDADGSVRKMGY